MRTTPEFIDVGLCPVVRVAEVDLVAQLQVDEGNERISESVRYTGAENVIENKCVVYVEAQRLSFLGAYQERRIDFNVARAVQRQYCAAARRK